MGLTIFFASVFFLNALFNVLWAIKWKQHIPAPASSIYLMRQMIWPIFISDSVVFLIGACILGYEFYSSLVTSSWVVGGSILAFGAALKEGLFLFNHRKDHEYLSRTSKKLIQ